MPELHYQSAAEMARALRAREVSAVELADAHLERIDAVDQRIGAYLAVTPELARKQAEAADW